MLFNSIHFLIFLPVVALCFFALPQSRRRWLLLLASVYFYGVFSLKLTLLMAWSSLLDFCCARFIDRSASPRVRKAWLVVSLVGNLATLGTFKYLDFVNESLASFLGEHPFPMLHLMLPMGISFYTFQAMSYTIDVYRGKLAARTSLLDFAVYVTFFPHLVAGPIMRGGDLIPQFAVKSEPSLARIRSGALLVIYGLVKKVFLSDPVGHVVDAAYGGDVSTLSGLSLLIATYGFAAQIYLDFSSYTDIAIGSGRILGFRVAENFQSPYLAVTVRDFWRRWHISLSHWLRDYLYVSLGGSRISPARTYVNLFLTMLLGGLWHGAAFTFVLWGALHGIYLAIERALGVEDAPSPSRPVARVLRWCLTFHLVCLAWVFFRATSVAQATTVLVRIATFAAGDSISPLPVLAVAAILVVQLIKTQTRLADLLDRFTTTTRWVAYASVLALVVALSGGRSPEFIYFQF